MCDIFPLCVLRRTKRRNRINSENEVAERLFFGDERIQSLNQIYLDLVNQSTQSPHFAQALDYVLHFVVSS